MKLLSLTLLNLLLSLSIINATHNMAGEITACQIDDHTIEVFITTAPV